MRTRAPIATEAFPKWLELLGLDPGRFSTDQEWEEGESITLGEWRDTEEAIAVFDCLALDDGELTAQLMLSRLLEAFVAEQSYTLEEILASPPELMQQLTLVRDIRKILSRDALVLARAEFSEALNKALAHYGAEQREDVQELIEDDAELAVLRRDALNALHAMSMAQFLQGEAGPAVRPQYSTVIRRWWNIDHMLAAHASIPEGVSLNLVKTPQDHDMFFCFVVRRGGNLYVLNDAPDYEHPLQSQMSRRPDRAFANRIAKFWFPYEMADVMLSEDGREARLGQPRDTRELVLAGKVDHVSQVVGSVEQMPARELLWVVMVFDRIMDRFWTPQPLPQLPLSYTAAQLRPEGQLLQEAAQAAGLPVVANTPGTLAVPDLSVDEVASLHHQEDAAQMLGEMGEYGALAWIERRYKDKIPSQGLNHVASEQAPQPRLGLDGQFDASPTQDDEDSFFAKDTALVSLQALPATTFGTAEQLRANRAFLARHNYASTLRAFAQQEYEQRKEEIRQWLDEAYATRVDFLKTLVPAAFAGGLEVCDWPAGQGPEGFEFVGGHGVKFRSDYMASIKEGQDGCSHQLGWMEEIRPDYNTTAFMPYLRTGGETLRGWKPLCQETGQKASYFFAVRPSNALELAWLLGKQVSELPDVLQELSALYPAAGNSILDRIDPMLWALKNPWAKFQLGARMGLSKRGLAQLQKQHPAVVDLSHLDRENLRAFHNAPAAVPSSRHSRSL